ncbi:MAG TPA: hypothetical protein VG890_00895 [Puia sp.]|nr:hypothetical protein [Puia sp.]
MRLKLYFVLLAAITCFAKTTFAQDIGTIGAQKPFLLNGGVQLRGIFYNASGIADRQTPLSYVFSGNLNFHIYGISMPVSFTVSEQERSFRQPFNQFGLSPHYKWITVHLGYRNINFSPYTLAGYTMLGAGVELNPGKFRFGFMYGRLNRATTLDTTTQSLVPVSFTRKAFAARIGYGTENNFIDFSVLKGKDDPSSVPLGKSVLDSLDVLPAANTVAGVSAKITIAKKIFIEGNVATSLYTRDINSPLTIDSSTVSFIKTLQSFGTVNGTSQLTTAMDGAIGVKEKLYTIKLQYRRIDPGFTSMGAYFFNNDLESYSFAPSFHLFKNKLRFNGSIGLQHDNLQRQKEATSKKIIGNAMLSADFTRQFGIDVNYTNFSNNQQPQTIRFADSLKIVQNTQNISVSPRITIVGTQSSHYIVVSANLMKLNDYNNYFSQNAVSRNIDYKQYYLNYTYSYLPVQLSAFINLSATQADAQGTSDQNKGATIGFTKAFFKSALMVSASGGFFTGTQNGTDEHTINASSNIAFKFLKHNSLTGLLFYTNNQPKNISQLAPAFSELRVELAYSYSF